MAEYKIKLQMFEGPFDLLLHLIDKNEVDIYDIPIAEITQQYLEYIAELEALDLDVASEFLVMAATLLAIKARMLLPKPPPEDLEEGEDFDPRAKLVQDLLEYKKIKEAAVCLESYYHNRQQLHQRDNDISLYSGMFRDVNPLEGKTLVDLASAFYGVWQRVKDDQIVHSIQRDAVSISSMMDKLYRRIGESPKGIVFTDIFSGLDGKLHVIVGFMALLELIKGNVVSVYQDQAFDRIYIMAKDLDSYELTEPQEF